MKTKKELDTLFDPKDLEILHDVVYAFPYPKFGFTIEYSTNDKEWSAYHYNEEDWDNRVILENEEEKFVVDIFLYNEYNLSVDEFQELKEFLRKDME